MNSTGKELVVRLKKGRPDDIVIAVMGSGGTGKSSFIRLLSGDPSVRVGEGLESETNDVQIVRFTDPVTGRNVIIVDTPGFDEGVTDTDTLKMITNFLLVAYEEKQKLNGLIYVQRISDQRFSDQSSRNMKMFRHLCGTEAYQNVVVLTTFWDKVESETGVEREEQLKTKFFKDLAQGGAQFVRHKQNIESARNVLRHILPLAPTNVQVQKEIREDGKTFIETAAGSVRNKEMEDIIAKHKKEVDELKVEIRERNKAERENIEKERVQLQKELARWETERAELKKGLSEAVEAQERLEKDAAKERENQEKLRQDQERKWNSQLDKPGREHDELVQRLQSQLDQEKSGCKRVDSEQEQESERQLQEQAMNTGLDIRKEREVKKRLEDQDREWKFLELLHKLQAQFDQEKKAREKLEQEQEQEQERRLHEQAVKVESETRKQDYEKWRQDLESEWRSKFDTQNEKFSSSIETLQAQLGQERRRCKILEDNAIGSMRRVEVDRIVTRHKEEAVGLREALEKERENLGQELARWEAERAELEQDRKRLEAGAGKEMKGYEKWRQDQESKWRSKFDAQTNSIQSLQVQLEQEKRRCKTLEDNAAGSMRRVEVEQMITRHKEEAAGFREAFEEERVRLQQELVRLEAKKAELEENLEEAREDRERLEGQAQDRESRWRSKFDTQNEMHSKSMQSMQAQLTQERQRRKILEAEQIITQHKKETAGLRAELEKTGKSNKGLEQEQAKWQIEKGELENRWGKGRAKAAGSGKLDLTLFR